MFIPKNWNSCSCISLRWYELSIQEVPYCNDTAAAEEVYNNYVIVRVLSEVIKLFSNPRIP